MRIQTALTRMVGIEHPVVQTGMGWVAGAPLVSAKPTRSSQYFPMCSP